MEADEVQNPGVNFPPPTLFVVSGICGSAMEAKFSLPLSALLIVPAQMVLGWSSTILGIALLAWAMATFAARKTAIYPNQPARELVAHGPYRISRNPMYVALTAIASGVALLADNLWMLLLLPVVLCVLTRFVIQREEHYLATAFGDSYLSYQARVRRWL